MALSRRTGQRFNASIWPGFVDAMTGLLMVLMFVLTIFTVVQFALSDTINGQEEQLGELTAEIASLADALGLEQDRSSGLAGQVSQLTGALAEARDQAESQASLIASLTAERDASQQALGQARAQITGFEAQVAGLLAERAEDRAKIGELDAQLGTALSEAEALDLALAQARTEIDAQTETARLAAARADAFEALASDLRARGEATQTKLDSAEAARLAEAAAAEALRSRLADADAELTAMSLALEEQRQAAEDTLTLLAAARAAQEDADIKLAAALIAQQTAQAALDDARNDGVSLREQLTELQAKGDPDALQQQLAAALASNAQQKADLAQSEQSRSALERRLAALLGDEAPDLEADLEDTRARLAAALAAQAQSEASHVEAQSLADARAVALAEAQQALDAEQAISAESLRKVEVLDQQVAELRSQVAQLQEFLGIAEAAERAANVQITSLGEQLNTALARVAAEERARAELEAQERARLAAERDRLAAQTQDLEAYKSDFFGELSKVVSGADGVRIEGDRFVFSSEVLFTPGAAVLSEDGKAQIARVADTLRSISDRIPPQIDWIIRVDGHTDNEPLSGLGQFKDNWELSQARALSVVRFMISDLAIPPQRLSANGFGEFKPIVPGSSPAARAQNRRIELKLTER